MPRAIWKGIVTFGSVRVPVKLYSAVESRDISFHLLHDADHARLKQQMVCDLEDKPVAEEEIVKGLPIDENVYVLVSPEEIAALEPETDRDIRVERFVPPEQVDPRFYDRPYHLGPDTDAAKYAALARALAESHKLGICRWSFRKRSYTGALSVTQGVLALVTLRLAEEIAPVKDLDIAASKLSERERNMAKYLVQEMTGEFKPEQYKNEYEAALRELIETKARGGKVTLRRAKAAKPTEARELAGILQASLERIRSAHGHGDGNGAHGNGGHGAAGRGKRSQGAHAAGRRGGAATHGGTRTRRRGAGK